jgi:DnaJ-class molecular chaperone
VLRSLFHNRPHDRFIIEENEIAPEEHDNYSSTNGLRAHWSTILHVAPHATMEEIRTAYQRLMRNYSPERFSQLAYEDSEAVERKDRLISDAYEAAKREKRSKF